MRRPDRLQLLTWFAIALAVGLVLLEGVALREAGQRLRAQEAAARARADSLSADAPGVAPVGGPRRPDAATPPAGTAPGAR